ncbi:MAG TPA: DUF5995 family protein [Chloroflexia bacterium]|nr:DUF5995 family protein [Chloroflexia bacterium]
MDVQSERSASLTTEGQTVINSTPLPLERPFTSIDEAIENFCALEYFFYTHHDRRAVFITAYLAITRELKLKVSQGFFQDNEWVRRYGIAFANLYRVALLAYEQGNLAAVPKAWVIAFDTAKNNRGLVMQDLVLGINAHINHDLPLALNEVGIDPERDKRYQDHTAVNQMLGAATQLMKDRVCAMYAPALSVLDHVLNPADDAFASFSVDKARESAWVDAVALANAANEAEKQAVKAHLDDNSAVLANLVLASVPPYHLLIKLLTSFESITPWWMYITIPEISTGKAAPVGSETLLVNSIDALNATLEQITLRYDSQRSKMAVFPAVYRQLVTQLSEGMKSNPKMFEDPEWIIQLELHTASQYLRALTAWEGDKPDEVPQAWMAAFQAISRNDVTVLQALLLMLNARLNRDMAVALLHAGISDDQEKRQRDFDLLNQFYLAQWQSMEKLISQKYGALFRFVEVVGKVIETLLGGFNFERAYNAAWENGLTLTQSDSDARRLEQIKEIDTRSTALAHRLLLQNIPGGGWVIEGLIHAEHAADTVWSEWMNFTDHFKDLTGRDN